MLHRRLVAGTVSRKYKIAIWIAMFIVIAAAITFTTTLVMQCNPVQYQWEQYDLTPHRGTCIPQTVPGILAGVFSVITDFYTVVLPAALLMKIQISPRQRWGLMLIFGLGFM